MKTFLIEHELPPLRAIYQCECEADTEDEALAQFAKEMPHNRVRKIRAAQFRIVCDFNGEKDKTCGWAYSQEAADSMLEGFNKWPACKNARIENL